MNDHFNKDKTIISIDEASPFDLNRYIVLRKWPLRWLFVGAWEADQNFRKRPWHEVIELPSKEFPLIEGDAKLSDGLNTIHFKVQLQYQPTIEYATDLLLKLGKPISDFSAKIESRFELEIKTIVCEKIHKLNAKDFISVLSEPSTIKKDTIDNYQSNDNLDERSLNADNTTHAAVQDKDNYQTKNNSDKDKSDGDDSAHSSNKNDEIINSLDEKNNGQKNDTNYKSLKDVEIDISKTVEAIFTRNNISCKAYCSLDHLTIIWPKRDNENPQLIIGEDFLNSVIIQNNKYFYDRKKSESDQIAKLEEQENIANRAKLIREKEKTRILREDQKLAQRNELFDLIIKKRKNITKARIQQKEDITKINLENEYRLNKKLMIESEKLFLTDETSVLELEYKQREAEEKINNIETKLARELEKLEIENIALKNQAENIVEIENQKEFFKILPEIIEKLGQHNQPIEHLSVLKLGDSTSGNEALPGSLLTQLVQALTVVRQTIDFLSSHSSKVDRT